MSTWSKPFSYPLLAALAAALFALASLPVAVAADELDDGLLADERDTIESDLKEDEADIEVSEPEHMKAFSEVRWPELTLKSLWEAILPPFMEKTAPPVVQDTAETFVEPFVAAPMERVVVPVVDDTISSVGIDRSPLNQAPRSTSLQRSLQNGRQALFASSRADLPHCGQDGVGAGDDLRRQRRRRRHQPQRRRRMTRRR